MANQQPVELDRLRGLPDCNLHALGSSAREFCVCVRACVRATASQRVDLAAVVGLSSRQAVTT